jgi:hypothetical protein
MLLFEHYVDMNGCSSSDVLEAGDAYLQAAAVVILNVCGAAFPSRHTPSWPDYMDTPSKSALKQTAWVPDPQVGQSSLP